VCGHLTPGAGRLADDPFASNQTECEHIVDAVTRLTAGVRPTVLRIHDLRHAAASRLIDAGLDPVTVASVVGHEDASITLKVYTHRFNRPSRDGAVRVALAAGGCDVRGCRRDHLTNCSIA
jgi:integrase